MKLQLGNIILDEWRGHHSNNIKILRYYRDPSIILIYDTTNKIFDCWFYHQFNFIKDIIHKPSSDSVEEIKTYIDRLVIKMYNLRAFK